MKNHWLIDDGATRREIHDYVRLMLGAPVVSVPLTDDQIDFCIDHAVRHITNVDMSAVSCHVTRKENELPADAALLVPTYYRDLKYRKVTKKEAALGTSVVPAYDWVIMYFSKQEEEWPEFLEHIKEGALACAYVVLHNTLSKGHKLYVKREQAEYEWNSWKQAFLDLYEEDDSEE